MANPNPSPSTRFGAPNGNPIAGGKTSDQRKAECEAAEKAAKLRLRMLTYIEESTAGDDEALMAYLKSETLKLFKDSEDRAHGAPEAPINLRRSGDLTDDELAAIAAGRGPGATSEAEGTGEPD